MGLKKIYFVILFTICDCVYNLPPRIIANAINFCNLTIELLHCLFKAKLKSKKTKRISENAKSIRNRTKKIVRNNKIVSLNDYTCNKFYSSSTFYYHKSYFVRIQPNSQRL